MESGGRTTLLFGLVERREVTGARALTRAVLGLAHVPESSRELQALYERHERASEEGDGRGGTLEFEARGWGGLGPHSQMQHPSTSLYFWTRDLSTLESATERDPDHVSKTANN